MPEHDAQLYELSHQQLAHPDVLQYGSLRDGRGAERAAALPDPDVEPRKPPPRIEKDAARIRHESLLGTVATIIFVVFQICDLSDSLSALMAGILILFPMHYRGR